jgi:hypothetical protein
MKKFVFAVFFAVCSIGFASATDPELLIVSELENNALDDVTVLGLEKEVSINLIKVEETAYGPNCYYSIVTTYFGMDGEEYTSYQYFSTYAYSSEHCNRIAGNSSVSLNSHISPRVGSVYYSNF